MIQWLGFAIMVDTWAAWVFLLWTVANLIPPARHTHKWYKAKFEEYPKGKKALLPGLL